MSGMVIRRVTAAAAVIAALGAVSACGAGSAGKTAQHTRTPAPTASASPMAYLLKAESAMGQTHSANMVSTETTGTLKEIDVSGVMDWSAGPQGTFSFSEKAQTPSPFSDSELKLTSSAMYMRVDSTYAEKLGGKHWLRIDYALLAKQGADDVAMVHQIRNFNPTFAVKMLIASGDVRRVGTESVKGVTATHYSGTVKAADIAADTQGLTAADVKAVKDQLAAAGIAEEKVDLWINADNLLVERKVQAQATVGETTSTTYYSDFGATADTSAPPAADTFDLKPVVGQTGAA